tara:strand:- start:3454 stop:3714 length:261 start_codon:yes stop_codon:yes gene_type:complete
MSWKKIIKNEVYTVKTTPPLQGYTPPAMPMPAKKAFYHLKDFIVSIPMGELQLRGTEFGNDKTPMKGNITSIMDGKQVAEFEIVPQ